ncbi:MAG: hypothetical protein ACXVZ2_10450 [Gaiellaceae bacterium]
MLRTLLAAAFLAATLAGTALAGDPVQRHNAADTAWAKAIGFQRSDFPAGWTAKASIPGQGASTTCKSFDPDESDLVETGRMDSPIFTATDGYSQVFSAVGIFQTAGQASASWNRLVRPGWLTCFSELITKSAPPGSTISVLSTSKLAFPKLASRMATYRLVIGVAPEGAAAAVKLYLDRVLLGAGRANVSTIMFSVGQPYPAAFEQKLAKAVARRLAR